MKKKYTAELDTWCPVKKQNIQVLCEGDHFEMDGFMIAIIPNVRYIQTYQYTLEICYANGVDLTFSHGDILCVAHFGIIRIQEDPRYS